MRLVCCADVNTLGAYVEQRTDQQVVFAIGGTTCRIASEIVATHETLYFHIEERNGEVLNVIVDTLHRHEFSPLSGARIAPNLCAAAPSSTKDA